MSTTTHTARITGPVPYVSSRGEPANIPLGPCLIEETDGEVADIVWGPNGERSTVVPMQVLEAAEESGHLVMLD